MTAATLTLLALSACQQPPPACPSWSSPGVAFEEVSEAAGLAQDPPGEDWGVAWGDADGDGWPDLWVTHHAAAPALYMNQGDGTFREESTQRLVGLPITDTHASAWADYDGDGDQDLLVIAGARQGSGATANQLWVFEDGRAEDRADALGAALPEGRGRVPIWLDADADGRLDLALINAPREDGLGASALLLGGDAGFSPAPASLGFEVRDSSGGTLAFLGGAPALVLGADPYPQQPLVLTGGGLVPSEALAEALETGGVHDALFGDLDCDGLQDAVLLRGWGNDRSEVRLVDGEVWASLATGEPGLPEAPGFDLYTAGAITLRLSAVPPVAPEAIWLGGAGAHPAELGADGVLTLQPGDHPGLTEEAGLSVGYQDGAWQVRLRAADWRLVGIRAGAEDGVQELLGVDLGDDEPFGGHRLLLSDGDSFRPGGSPDAGPGCAYGALGDFDNDMDLDLFLSCASPTGDLPDELWLNRGDGSFERAEAIGDGEGRGLGRSSAPAVADYDGDGNLDIFLSHARATETDFDDGPPALLHSLGSGYHWLEVDLVGAAPRDATGATLALSAGGVTQVRHLLGGLHSGVQDHPRVHFGLGESPVADALVITWPDGEEQYLTDIEADQILTISQGER